MSENGYIKLHRKIMSSWQWKKPEYFRIWIWMLLKAEYEDNENNGLKRSQVLFSIPKCAKECGLKESTVRYFITHALEERDISWFIKSKPFSQSKKNNKENNKEDNKENNKEDNKGRKDKLSIITLLNYELYQGEYSNGFPCNNKEDNKENNKEDNKEDNKGYSLYEKNKEVQEIRSTPLLSPLEGGAVESAENLKPKRQKRAKKVKPEPPKDHESIKAALDQIKLADYQEYLNKGVEVKDVWRNFSDACLYGTPRDPEPNPYDYVNFKMAFRTWLERELKKTAPIQSQLSDVPLCAAHRPYNPDDE